MLAAALLCGPALVFRPVRPVANVRAVEMSLGEGPVSLDVAEGTVSLDVDVPPAKSSSSSDALRAEIADKKQAAGDALELSEAELDLTLSSLQQAGSATHDDLNWTALRALLVRSAHLPHKDWKRTEAAAAELEALLSDPADATFRDLFHRVLTDGNWPAAEQAAVRAHPNPNPNPSPTPSRRAGRG